MGQHGTCEPNMVAVVIPSAGLVGKEVALHFKELNVWCLSPRDVVKIPFKSIVSGVYRYLEKIVDRGVRRDRVDEVGA